MDGMGIPFTSIVRVSSGAASANAFGSALVVRIDIPYTSAAYAVSLGAGDSPVPSPRILFRYRSLVTSGRMLELEDFEQSCLPLSEIRFNMILQPQTCIRSAIMLLNP